MESPKSSAADAQSSYTQRTGTSEIFNRFETVIADTAALKHECFALRYMVYCEDHDWLTHENRFNPDKIEKDIYDVHSVHGLLLHKGTGLFFGTVRLILYDPSSSGCSFPVQVLCTNNKISLPELAPLWNTAEISRFCIPKRCRKTILDYEEEAASKQLASSYPTSDALLIALVRVLVALARQNNIQQWYAEMEPRLIERLEKLGIFYDKIGPPIEFHGTRQICHKKLDEWFERVHCERPDIWGLISNED
ncbi:PEP-CTERM/exosortase system-associated acyltransferase [Pseudomonas plecoglossicida]|uniref:PEP-CTERM/exosortase system-associated acyltransferase n=1 Tax=Pseudomonas plecoglossicida TaxID=70775 RepID=UPI000491261B|nr:PEP-CTERM/exosortase system-associated acyltransferase [Pseudomonas plecoglossicida]GLR36231.1 hypothetical protein GCM10011247_16280 [Pseudomonas plecoglossicida]